MKHLKRSFILMMLLTVIIGPRTFGQDYFSTLNPFHQLQNTPRAKEVLQDNEYTPTGYELGSFYDHPLLLNGESLDYNAFNVKLEGELTVVKAAVITGRTTPVAFYCYLRRDGNKVPIPGREGSNVSQTKIEISEILKHAKAGDQLVIEPVNREDGPVKRILKIPEGGC